MRMTDRMWAGWFTLLVMFALVATSAAEDWPQWMGTRRDSVWRETGIVERFPAGGPPLVWRRDIGYGYAGPSVAGGRVFVADFLTDSMPVPLASRRHTLPGVERVWCLRAETGDVLWKHEDPCTYNISFPYGPRVTPTVDEDRVYTLGAEGHLLCLSVADGSVIWSKRLPEVYQCETPMWGFAGHPLVDEDRLICIVGGDGSVAVALNKLTGEEIWRALAAKEPGYCAPAIIHAGGRRQLLIWHSAALNSLDPVTGQVYWSEELEPDWGMSIAVPRFEDPYLFVGGFEGKSLLLELAADRPAARVVWSGRKGRGIAPVFNTPFLESGYLYGVDRWGELRCVELRTGEQVWSTYRATSGERSQDNASAFLVKQQNQFFIFNDAGQLIIARLTPQGYDERGRAAILQPLSQAYGRNVLWSHPAFAQRCIFARNDREIVCYALAAD